jgi:NodT family efflux transporter outer membrane factor (OMF) lipoprotein
VIVSAALALAGCSGLTAEPAMRLPLPATFSNALPPSRPPVDLTQYWSEFGDAMLDHLIHTAIAQNFSIKAAEDRVVSAADLAAAADASLLPSLDAAGSVAEEKLSPVGRPFPEPSPGRLTSGGTVDLSWTLPLFGRFGATKNGAAAILGVAGAEQNEARVAVVAEIARDYITLRADQRDLALLKAELAESNHIARLVEIRAQAGVASKLDLARAQNHADEIALELPAQELSIKTNIEQIAVLEGETAPDPSLGQLAPIPPAPHFIPALVPADLLRRRPDIIEAEAEVASDAADLHIAMADLFPQLTLGGSLSIFSGVGLINPLTATKLPDTVTMVEGGPGITIPLIDWGQRYHEAKAAQATLAAAIENYHEAVVEGCAAVETAFAEISATRAQVAAATREQQSAEQALSAANTLFGRGLTDLSTLLDAEQQREKAGLDATEAEAAADTALISLSEAVGGGLPEPAEQSQNAPLPR